MLGNWKFKGYTVINRDSGIVEDQTDKNMDNGMQSNVIKMEPPVEVSRGQDPLFVVFRTSILAEMGAVWCRIGFRI